MNHRGTTFDCYPISVAQPHLTCSNILYQQDHKPIRPRERVSFLLLSMNYLSTASSKSQGGAREGKRAMPWHVRLTRGASQSVSNRMERRSSSSAASWRWRRGVCVSQTTGTRVEDRGLEMGLARVIPRMVQRAARDEGFFCLEKGQKTQERTKKKRKEFRGPARVVHSQSLPGDGRRKRTAPGMDGCCSRILTGWRPFLNRASPRKPSSKNSTTVSVGERIRSG
ncbi:uncharacterized protein BDZ83DRAFT_178026 [Colletotrichum acutatum]|uniref:Uncharacterized protein n=1 Tax=Glomerella acutata TaxID=27357 RepID=A0AAD8XJD9_GLOAC|nr:uncharacterized protein BDZ83DRAFT_178026 [Colletotrichum acutatum]KAK1727843.1 hypothetical protein BDZ83DRAFT_178026 [Colletotrichum acutatum]